MDHYQSIHMAQETPANSDASVNIESLPGENHISSELPTLDLVQALCQALKVEGIAYCHWKSNNALELSASGDNDLDLLVSRADKPRFTELLYRLGFKQSQAPARKRMPGVLDYFGYDDAADKFVHVHAHYQLILGHDMTKNYRLPIESQYLGSAVQGDLFKVPAPEYEFIVFVIRMVLKHSTWDVILAGQGLLKVAERQELAYLQTRINQERVIDILNRHFPFISIDLFNNCIQALQPPYSAWARMKTGHQLQTTLQANARRSWSIDSGLKLWRRAVLAVHRRVFKSLSKYVLEGGGAVIAIVGGDGAGKSTAVDGLYDWLSKHFETTSVHMGKPAWSWTTITVRAILKIGNLLGLYPGASSFRKTLHQKSPVSPGYPWLLRAICIARDRYWTYVGARRFAANGGLVILDRFPLPQIRIMDGPQVEQFVSQLIVGPQSGQLLTPHRASRLTRFLERLEERYYQQIVSPEILIVLRVDPEIAVKRKTDEDASSVRERSTEIWELDWAQTEAHIIDASKSQTDVLAELKALIWPRL